MENSSVQRLVFALDFPDFLSAVPFLSLLSGKVGVVKIGLELFLGEGPGIVAKIREKTDAAIFLDLKLHDIPATVARSVHNLRRLGVDYLTLHTAGGGDMLARAREAAGDRLRLLGVTVLTSSSHETLAETGFVVRGGEEGVRELVEKRALLAKNAGLSGVVCSGHEAARVKALCGEGFLAVTPGIRPLWSLGKKDDQERVMTPSLALAQGADLLVIGRPIRDAADPQEAVARILMEIAGV